MEHAPGTDWNRLRDQPFALLQAMESRLRAARGEAAGADAKTWSGLEFRLGGRWWLAPREDVREVAALPRLTRVPGARPWLLGVANVRGSLLPVTDLARLLDLPRAGGDARQQRLLVLESDATGAGFLVDEVGGQRQFAPGDQHPALLDAAGALRPWLLGGFRRDGQDWPVLSLRRLARSDEFLHAGA